MRAWEQRKFESCFNFPVSTNSLSRAMLNYDDGEIKNIHYGDVLIKYPSILDIKREDIPYIIDGTLEKYKSNLLENGDLIFADAAEDETVGKAVEIRNITFEKVVSGLHTIVARAKEQKAEYFLGYYINSDIYHKQLLRLMQGSKVSAISKKNLQETDISFPKDFEEQQKIGTFFKQLDDTIALHQRKIEQLKLLKQAFLQKMFVNHGSTPEMRFTEFDEEWEQHKLGEMAVSFEYGLNASATEYDGENKYIRITDIDESSHEFMQSGLTSPDTELSVAENYLLKEGDVLFARTGASVGKSYRYKVEDGHVYYAGFLIRARIKPDFDSEFIFQNTLTTKYNNFISVTSQRSGQPGVNAQEYARLEFSVPSLHEQMEIGQFFHTIDDTIALHQKKLINLKKLKKAFLQSMFI